MSTVLQSLISDIAVAMFKVASIITRNELKAAIENQAIHLTANPNSDNISRAENLIILGREIGEIKPINAYVLLRELEKLNRALLTPSIAEEIDISSMFTESDLSAAIHSATSRMWTGNVIHPPAIGDNNQRYKEDKWRPSSTLANKESNNSPANVLVDTGTANKVATIKPTRPNAVKKTLFNADKVYQYIKTRKEIKLKELKTEFSEVSGRTIRRVTESLMKEGKIERVGNPGPTSYYRLVVPPVSAVTPPAPAPTASNTPIATPEALLSAPAPEKPLISSTSGKPSSLNKDQNQAIINANQAIQETKQWTPVFSPSAPQNTASKPSDSASASVIALPGVTQA